MFAGKRIAVALGSAALIVGAGSTAAMAATPGSSGSVGFTASIPAQVTMTISPPASANQPRPGNGFVPLTSVGTPMSFGSFNGGSPGSPTTVNSPTTENTQDEGYRIDITTNDGSGYTLTAQDMGFQYAVANGDPTTPTSGMTLSQSAMYSAFGQELAQTNEGLIEVTNGPGARTVEATGTAASDDVFAIYPSLTVATAVAGVYTDSVTFTASGN